MNRNSNIMTVVFNIAELVTLKGKKGLRKGKEMSDVEILHDAYFAFSNGIITEVGINFNIDSFKDAILIDAKSSLVTPGLIDSHTHLVHAGSRENELKLKLEGVSYLDILKSGGGILSTVKATRAASFDELYLKASRSLDLMLGMGVTTVEAKSGYGLNLETEIKQLEVVKEINKNHPIELVSTFMAAHAIPNEYKDNRETYIKLVKEMIHLVKERELAEAVDVFCETGVFSVGESEDILSYAKSIGLTTRIHADEIDSIGGVKLAVKLKSASSEHLMATTNEDIELLSNSDVVLTILPNTSFNLDKGFARTRTMIDSGCGLAIASDYNPGSSPSENLQLAMQIAAIKTKMTPKEVITAVTYNAAYSLSRVDRIGSIEVGKDANFVIYDCDNLDYLIYHFGINHTRDVYIKGELVVESGKVKRRNL